jgi:adenosylcobinamide kinase/adenosylcobinamide-phosphate guanylyltransferase
MALELAGRAGPRIFVATAQALDDEMAERICRHQVARGSAWPTVEVPIDLVTWFEQNQGRYRTVVLDCITLWLSNLQGQRLSESVILRRVDELIPAIRRMGSRVIVVTNELGMGLVPFEPGLRRFRDLAGRVNQRLAREADEVYFVVAGLAVRMK